MFLQRLSDTKMKLNILEFANRHFFTKVKFAQSVTDSNIAICYSQCWSAKAFLEGAGKKLKGAGKKKN